MRKAAAGQFGDDEGVNAELITGYQIWLLMVQWVCCEPPFAGLLQPRHHVAIEA